VKFWKMSGSGNDFVFIDGIGHPSAADIACAPDVIRAVCAQHTGVGADGLAFFETSGRGADFALRYFNRDGSEGELCGNASLCAVRLSTELGLARPTGLLFHTMAGLMHGRIRNGRPEVDLQAVQGLRPDAGIPRGPAELALGFADTGVPHLVIRTETLAEIPLPTRGPELRFHPSLIAGANVNWVARGPRGWSMRTYERGVEAETLACGTGAVACAALLRAWGETVNDGPTALQTRSGQILEVRFRDEEGQWFPTLSGEGRIVFEGTLREL
jgi:diaminopimelate epimerase